MTEERTATPPAGELLRTPPDVDDEARLLHLIGASPAILYCCRLTGGHGTTFISPNVRELLGYEPREVVSDPNFFRDRVHPEDADRVAAALDVLLEVGSALIEYRIRGRNGTYRWIRDELRVVCDEAGVSSEIVGSITDITHAREAEEASRAEQRRLKDRLRELQNELAHASRLSTAGELSSIIAHELNQPLAAIVNFSGACIELLRQPDAGVDDLVPYLKSSNLEARRAGEVLARLRGFVQRRDPHRTPLRIDDVLRETLPLVRGEAKLAGVTIELDLAESLPDVLVDRIQIQQVVVNLVRNAIEAIADSSCEERSVRIETAIGRAGEVEVLVRDTGPGLSDEARARLFEPFYTTKSDGMGLGLSICTTIIEMHGGSLVAESDDLGRTVLCFRLPTRSTGRV